MFMGGKLSALIIIPSFKISGDFKKSQFDQLRTSVRLKPVSGNLTSVRLKPVSGNLTSVRLKPVSGSLTSVRLKKLQVD